MKKTLAAVAVLGAFAGSALAADVTFYGKVDLGLGYLHQEVGSVETDDMSLNSGSGSSSRFGLKGSEQISEGLTVGFQLEHGFKADQQESTKLFSREMRLYVASDFGTLHMGRFGGLDSTTGSVSVASSLYSMGGGYGTESLGGCGVVVHKPSRMANSIAYVSPEFGGVKVSAMASLGEDYNKLSDPSIKVEKVDGKDVPTYVKPTTVASGKEGSSDVDRYYALGLKGQWGGLGAGLVFSMEDFGSEGESADHDNSKNVTAGVNYDFGFAKTFLAANWYDNGADLEQTGVVVGLEAPLPVGSMEFQAGYGKVKDSSKRVKDVAQEDAKAFVVGGLYKYPLSKRTYLYTAAGYQEKNYDDKAQDDTKTIEAVAGLVHNF